MITISVLSEYSKDYFGNIMPGFFFLVGELLSPFRMVIHPTYCEVRN